MPSLIESKDQTNGPRKPITRLEYIPFGFDILVELMSQIHWLGVAHELQALSDLLKPKPEECGCTEQRSSFARARHLGNDTCESCMPAGALDYLQDVYVSATCVIHYKGMHEWFTQGACGESYDKIPSRKRSPLGWELNSKSQTFVEKFDALLARSILAGPASKGSCLALNG
jgi:hypothetical protein